MSRPEIRLFNRHSYLSENNKIENLSLAAGLGFSIPATIVTNDFGAAPADSECWIQKPVAGGAFTTSLQDFLAIEDPNEKSYPRFIQRMMHRPELRIYRIWSALFGFRLSSPISITAQRTTSRSNRRTFPWKPGTASSLFATRWDSISRRRISCRTSKATYSSWKSIRSPCSSPSTGQSTGSLATPSSTTCYNHTLSHDREIHMVPATGLQMYEGLGDTLEMAVEEATRKIPARPHRDFVVSRVVEWGMQFGGFTGAKSLYAKLIEDEHATFKT